MATPIFAPGAGTFNGSPDDFDPDASRRGVCDYDFSPWDLEPSDFDPDAESDPRPYTTADGIYDVAFGLGYAMVNAACPRGLTDLQEVVWRSGYHQGQQAAIREEMDRLDSWDAVLAAGRDEEGGESW